MMQWILTATTVALVGTAACASNPPKYSALEGESAQGESTAPAFPHYEWTEVDAAVKSGAVLVDARGPEEFAKGHIAGAINIPAGDEAALAQLPADKATPVIFYCGGPACNASTKDAQKAKALGYQKVAEYKGGYPEWSKAQVSQ
ncbi:MAG: rhodanese-like domain-containing protein [Myxococcota bacterium]